MTTSTSSAAGIGLPKSDFRPIASDARQLFHLLDAAVEKLRTAPAVPEIFRLQKDLGPLLGTSRDLAQNAVVSLELDRDYEAAMQPLRPVSAPEAFTPIRVADHLNATRMIAEGVFLAARGLDDDGERNAMEQLVYLLQERLNFMADRLTEVRATS